VLAPADLALRRSLPALALASALLVSGVGRAAVVPEYDTDREFTHLSSRLTPSTGVVVGTWRGNNAGNRLQPPRSARWGSWFPAGEGTSVSDGTARLRIRATKKVEAALVMRATVEAGKVATGYRARLRGRTINLERVTGDKATRLTGQESVARWPSGSVELVMTVMGPHLIVQVWDPRKGTLLASLHAKDATHSAGRVGLLSRNGRDKDGRFALLSTRAACGHVPPTRGGPTVFVTVEKDSVPEGVLAQRMETLGGFPRREVWRTDTLGLERLWCVGKTATTVSLEMPWKYQDPAYRRYRRYPPKVVDGRVRLDRSYKNPAMVKATLETWHELHPELTHLEEIGKSRQGRAIMAMAIGRGLQDRADRPTFFINGAHHGNELLSVEFVLDHIAQLLEGAGADEHVDRWLDSFVVWAVPIVNPDGLEAFLEVSARTGRKNGADHNHDGERGRLEGVDLNRNYPFKWGSLGEKGSRSRKSSVYYRGAKAGSEPEVQAIMKLAERERFVAALTYHTGTVAVLAPYTIDGAEDPKNNEAWTVAEELVRVLPAHPQRRDFNVKRNLYPVDGTDQDWHRFAHGTLALLIEGARHTPAVVKQRSKIVEAVRPGFGFLLDRFLDGPSVTVHVRDLEGFPVEAEVRVVEMAPQNGEVWTTRCPTGRFDRYLPGKGKWNLEIRVPDMAPFRTPLDARDTGHQELTVHIPVANSQAVRCEGAEPVPPEPVAPAE
jgi:hypothetical protein